MPEITYFFGSVALAVINAVQGTELPFAAVVTLPVLMGACLINHPVLSDPTPRFGVLEINGQRSFVYETCDGRERKTIDSEIRFMAGPDSFSPDDGAFIVKTKFANGHGIADAVLRHHHQFPTKKYSKYCVGMSAAGEAQRFNRFRPALKRLDVLPAPAPATPMLPLVWRSA
jgi:hypothetical protein